MSPGELNSKLEQWRAKQAAEGLSIEELVEGVQSLSAGRVSAQIASTTSRTTKAAAKAPIAQETLDDIFGELGA